MDRIHDSFILFKRCLLLSIRNVEALITAVMLPVVLMVVFVYLFGGAVETGADTAYVNYVVPGVIVLCVSQCAGITALSVNADVSKGIADRFRSMPIAQSALLTGHVLASTIRNCLTTALVILVAVLIGFSPAAGLAQWLLAAGLLILYMLVITWLAVLVGLAVKTPDSAGGMVFVVVILPYLSSGFVPTETMPGILRAFSENQPLTPVIESLRSLFLYSSPGDRIFQALLWCAALLLAFSAAAAIVYKRKRKA